MNQTEKLRAIEILVEAVTNSRRAMGKLRDEFEKFEIDAVENKWVGYEEADPVEDIKQARELIRKERGYNIPWYGNAPSAEILKK